MMKQPDACIVRITGAEGNTKGTGFLIATDGRIATCHHVVKELAEPHVAFPSSDPCPAPVIAADEAHDVVILKLEGELPPGVEPARLGRSAEGYHSDFHSRGYRRMGEMQGIPAEGRVLHAVSESRGLRHQPLILKSQDIREGMSGAPVYIPDLDCVVGMITGYWDSLIADTGFRDAETAFATPSEAVLALCPDIPAATDRSQGNSSAEPPRSFFVAHVYNEKQIDDLRDAISRAVEGTIWQPVYADDHLVSGHILHDKISPFIAESEFSLFEISDPTRPNVFIELGIALALGKPVYLLLEKGKSTPADLAGRDRIEYRSFRDLSEKLRTLLFEQDRSFLLGAYERHTYFVNSLALTADSHTLISGGGDQRVFFWDLESGEIEAVINNNKWVGCVSLAPSNNHLATSDGNGVIRIWDLASRALLYEQKAHEGYCRTVDFSASGRVLASGGGDGKICLWTVPELEAISTLEAHAAEVRQVSFHPIDEQQMASCGEDGMCYTWSVQSATHDCILALPVEPLYALAYSANGKQLAIAGSDGTVRLWSVPEKRLLWERMAHLGPVAAMCFHPSNRWLATSGQDKLIKLWDLETEQLVSILRGHQDTVRSIVFTRDGRMLISGGKDKSVRKWRIPS